MSAISGQKAVTTAGTALALGSGQVHGPLMIKALAANTGNMFIGNDGAGDVTSGNGLELGAGDVVVFAHIALLTDLIVDSAIDGEGVAWLMLG